jgi:hypothetical protein
MRREGDHGFIEPPLERAEKEFRQAPFSRIVGDSMIFFAIGDAFTAEKTG